MFVLPKKKNKRCKRKPPIISNIKHKIWAHRPSIKGTKPLFVVIKAIIIITLILPSRREHPQQSVDKDIEQLRARDASLRYTCIKRDCCTFCVIWSQMDCCAIVNLLQSVNVWYMKHVDHVPESCLRHCNEGVPEVDVDSIVLEESSVTMSCNVNILTTYILAPETNCTLFSKFPNV